MNGDRPIMLIYYLLCYAAVLKILTYYAQYYAHVKYLCLNLTVLLEYIYLYHKLFNVYTHCSSTNNNYGECSIRV